MTLNELIDKVEEQGYALNGKQNIGPLGKGEVMRAPLCLIPTEPPVEDKCVMIPDVMGWEQLWEKGWSVMKGYSRIEGAATITPATVVRLQFIGEDHGEEN